jgi:hypothetical protein
MEASGPAGQRERPGPCLQAFYSFKAENHLLLFFNEKKKQSFAKQIFLAPLTLFLWWISIRSPTLQLRTVLLRIVNGLNKRGQMACGNEERFDLMLGIAASTCARNVATIFFFLSKG